VNSLKCSYLADINKLVRMWRQEKLKKDRETRISEVTEQR
jgi:hypothetical protein